MDQLRNRIVGLEAQLKNDKLQSDLRFKEIAELKAQLAAARDNERRYVNQLTRAQEEHTRIQEEIKANSKFEKTRGLLVQLLVEKHSRERDLRRHLLDVNNGRLGRWQLFTGKEDGLREMYCEGEALRDIDQTIKRINRELDEISFNRKLASARRKSSARRSSSMEKLSHADLAANPKSSANEEEEAVAIVEPLPDVELPRIRLDGPGFQTELLNCRYEILTKERADFLAIQSRLQRELSIHYREYKRIRDEDTSYYNDFRILKQRYLLLTLVGRGGFSEVYKAFDLEEMRYVAVKIGTRTWVYHMDSRGPTFEAIEREHAYKKVVREFKIQQRSDHPHIVTSFDLDSAPFHDSTYVIFQIQEYIDGQDLDYYLKMYPNLPESHAKSILLQILSALCYLNHMDPPIVHYDLKPGNILIKEGHVCLTDFGLARESTGESIDVTSRGAGTHA